MQIVEKRRHLLVYGILVTFFFVEIVFYFGIGKPIADIVDMCRKRKGSL